MAKTVTVDSKWLKSRLDKIAVLHRRSLDNYATYRDNPGTKLGDNSFKKYSKAQRDLCDILIELGQEIDW